MIHKRCLLFFSVLLFLAFIVNSCKKTNTNPIQSLFTSGSWQLASVTTTYYTGGNQDSAKTVTDSCTQIFVFSANLTCSYTNFDCITQVNTGTWSLTGNNLYLNTTISSRDTTAAGNSAPFKYAQIRTLGQFSLVVRTGDFAPVYSTTAKTVTVDYGFIRAKTIL